MPGNRLAVLEKMVQSPSADAFAWYGLALEYRKLERFDEALKTFEHLRSLDANYLPMYLMAGQLLIQQKQLETARSWLEAGILVAKSRGDHKTLGELQSALADTH